MKITRINIDGTMNDVVLSQSNKSNIIKKLNKLAVSSGETKLKELYKWSVTSNLELLCYGWYDGSVGFENKHDLPPNGISPFLDDDGQNNSSTRLLFGNIFIILYDIKSETLIDCPVSEYASYYNILFEGFDDCNTSDDDVSDDDSIQSIDKDFINDDSDSDSVEDEEYNIDNEELDIDSNSYSDEDEGSEYNEEYEGEDEDEDEDEDEGEDEDEDEDEGEDEDDEDGEDNSYNNCGVDNKSTSK